MTGEPAAAPEHSHGRPLDQPQPSTERRDVSGPPRSRPPEGTLNRAYLEALLIGVPLPATKRDLLEHARADGGADAARALDALPERRFSTLEEVGEALRPVQPAWARQRRVPVAESDLPPGGSEYGR